MRLNNAHHRSSPECPRRCDNLADEHSTFYRRIADGTIPKPIKMGSLSRWSKSEIMEMIEEAKARRLIVIQSSTAEA